MMEYFYFSCLAALVIFGAIGIYQIAKLACENALHEFTEDYEFKIVGKKIIIKQKP